ncbi:hypothetical protein GUJ93_ZPchr0008g13106 [Zizania palustris]|uniref:Uncharacterized protein n=1 Tax=Zizania palustris TaxID=103762 RepID=A0A8J5RCC7_ZIZPA|nr:hypothetical protein GUJ93_ZPchr0008g13106 [Zizania palustris]
MTGFPTAPSPSPIAVAEGQGGEGGDADGELPTMEKQPRVDFPCVVTPATTDEDYNRSPNFVVRSLGSTNCDGTNLAPQPLPSHADDEGVDPEKDGDYVGDGDEDRKGEDDDEDAMLGGLKLVTAHLGPRPHDELVEEWDAELLRPCGVKILGYKDGRLP